MSRNARSNLAVTGLLAGMIGVMSFFTAGPVVAAANLFSTATPARATVRVVVAQDSRAMRAFQTDDAVVREMVARAVMALTDAAEPAAAWRTFVSPEDVVGLKVMAAPGALGGTRPAVVGAVIEGLLSAGVPAANVVIWDKQWEALRAAGFVALAERSGVRVAGAAAAGYDPAVAYDTPLLGKLVWGDLEFGRTNAGVGRKSFVSKLVTRELTKIINISPLLNHNHAGVAGQLYGLALGSVDNTWRFENDATRLAEAVPEIYALPELGDRVVLNIVDALLCQYQGYQRVMLHYSTVLNEIWMSRDPVALDVLSLEELARQRERAGMPPGQSNQALYQNAALLELGVADRRQIDLRRLP